VIILHEEKNNQTDRKSETGTELTTVSLVQYRVSLFFKRCRRLYTRNMQITCFPWLREIYC